jgi:hypothetical protein
MRRGGDHNQGIGSLKNPSGDVWIGDREQYRIVVYRIALAHAYEQATEWHKERPKL